MNNSSAVVDIHKMIKDNKVVKIAHDRAKVLFGTISSFYMMSHIICTLGM